MQGLISFIFLVTYTYQGMLCEPACGHAEEHMARLTAEGEAVDYSRRLTVAQEQLAEYAAQKEEDAAGYLQQAQSLQALLAKLLQSTEDSAAKEQLQAASTELCQKLTEEAGEAKNFAAQQKADVERAKRSSSQVKLGLLFICCRYLA